MTKLYAQRKDVFDIDKVTVVGTPTITSDGVASGFSNSTSYIKVSNIPFSTNWKINFTAHYNKVTSSQVSLGIVNSSNNKYILRLWYRGNTDDAQIVPYYDNGATFYADRYIPTDNTTYKYEIWNDGVNINYKIINADTGLLIKKNILSAGDYTLGNIKADIYIGVNNTLGEYFAGSINLKDFKIYIDNQLVYSPTKPVYALERRKEGFDLSKFTVVGSPTITEYGVASGFSSTNYLKVSNIPSPTNSLNIEIGFVVPSSISVQHQILAGANSSNIATFFFDLNVNNPRYQLAFGSSNTADISGWLNLGDIDFGKYVKFKFTWDGSVYKFYKSVENSEYVQVGNSINSSTPINFSQFYVGVQSNTNTPYITGSINLPSFSITVDGKEVFTGAKEKFYAMRGR